MSVLLPALSQKTYPAVGDWDECWMMATIWAAEMSDSCLARSRPSVYRWRQAAGDPDDGYRDGGTLTEIHIAVDKVYPTALNHMVLTTVWDAFADNHLRHAHPVSIAVNSAHLPSRMRYGFYSAHQVGIWRSPKTGYIYCMNPLQDQGDRPQRITGPELKYAAMTIPGDAYGKIVAECFTPIPVHLRYGGVKLSSPFPDRMRIASKTGRAAVYNRPDKPDLYHRVAVMENGDLFVAYQRVKVSGRTFYGDHRGTKWVNTAKLDYQGGKS